MSVILAYCLFVPIAALCFARLNVRAAILAVLVGGWWALPVARYPPGATGTLLPWWISGIVLPTDMLLTKAWIPPLVAFIGAALRDPASLRQWRPGAIDLPMAGWCLWPLIAGVGRESDPSALVASLYITGSWGMAWLLGRIWLGGAEGRLALMRALALSGLANLPVAIIEGTRPAMLYGLVYGPHPYRFDGIDRYIGYRPLGFFENGNLYGLWSALAAFAALWIARRDLPGRRWIALVVLNVVIALASQSIGAILLLGAGLGLLWLWRRPFFLPAMAAAAAGSILLAAVHLSGVIPLQSIARTPAGERAIAAMRAIGRGSLLWRVSQDAKALPIVKQHPWIGSARWDWWRPIRTRPAGQAMLLIGQFGLIGLMLAWGGLIAACGTALVRLRHKGERGAAGDAALPLAIIVLLALADAALNAFFFFPAVVAAGAIAATALGRRPERANRVDRAA